jgi:hypothetical protein
MKRTKSITAQSYGPVIINVEAYSVIKDILYNATTNIVTLIYEYDDFITEKNKVIDIMIKREQFNEDSYRYTYWGTSVEHRATLSTNTSGGGYGSSVTNLTLNVMNDVFYSYIFYHEMIPLEETRDSKISDIIG